MRMIMKMRRNIGERENEINNKNIKLFSENYSYPQRDLQFFFMGIHTLLIEEF